MAVYAYKAFTETGTPVSGSITAENPEAARRLIAELGYVPDRVREDRGAAKRSGARKPILGRVRAPELILFTKQFRTMLVAGITMVNALQVLESQTENPLLKSAVIDIQQQIRGGSTVYAAFSRHPRIFNALFCNMLAAGEASGTLPEVLDRLIYIIQHEYKVRKDVRSAMSYPAIVLVMLCGAFLFLLTFVVPKFISIFQRTGLELPVPTQMVMVLYTALTAWWPVLLGGGAAVLLGLSVFLRTPQGKLVRDRLLLKLPVLGGVFQKAAMSRFASIFAILQSSGVTVLESVRIISGTIGNAAIAREFDNLREKLEQGRGISGPLRSSRYFPPLVINMIAVGEETGQLDDMLKEVAAHYDYEVGYAISRMSDLLGPVLIVVLAAVVGFFALAIFMPMWDLTKMVRH